LSLEEAGKLLAMLEARGVRVEGVEKLDAGGLEVTVLDLGKAGRRRLLVVVLPPGTPITVKTARRAIEAADLVAGGSDRVLVILYSSKGKLTKTAYLYMGLALTARGIDSVIVNGPPEEVVEVVTALKRKGRVVLDEEKTYPAKW